MVVFGITFGNGWERIVSEKLYSGEDIGWKIKAFLQFLDQI